jgi:hypothetical protein
MADEGLGASLAANLARARIAKPVPVSAPTVRPSANPIRGPRQPLPRSTLINQREILFLTLHGN